MIKIDFYRLPRYARNDGKGFTLLELLVVIGIIGLLMALATVAYSTTQKSGRNSRRKQDMVAIQNSLEQYYAANSFVYPAGSCSTASTYMKSSWPSDPSSPTTTYTETCSDPTTYCVCAAMESSGGAATSGNSGANCDYSGPKTYYCVSNLQ